MLRFRRQLRPAGLEYEHGWRLRVYQALREQRGVENASPYDYGKQASELDIPQAALIARVTKAPTKYSPDLRPDRAKMRRGAVTPQPSHRRVPISFGLGMGAFSRN